jgi:thymidylate synthase (FAD)
MNALVKAAEQIADTPGLSPERAADYLDILRGNPVLPAWTYDRKDTPVRYTDTPLTDVLHTSRLSNRRAVADYITWSAGESRANTWRESAADYVHSTTHASSLLAMFAGQLCYQSFAPGFRSPCESAGDYLNRLISDRPAHGAVLEHVVVTMLVTTDRGVSHELVRHRLASWSQMSTRYVGENDLWFYRRLEDPVERFVEDCRVSTINYRDRITHLALLAQEKAGKGPLSRDDARELRKQVRQAARTTLPHATGTAITMTLNVRSWRNLLDQRAHPAADSAMSELAFRCYLHLLRELPDFFADYTVTSREDLFGITRMGVTTPNPKV